MSEKGNNFGKKEVLITAVAMGVGGALAGEVVSDTDSSATDTPVHASSSEAARESQEAALKDLQEKVGGKLVVGAGLGPDGQELEKAVDEHFKNIEQKIHDERAENQENSEARQSLLNDAIKELGRSLPGWIDDYFEELKIFNEKGYDLAGRLFEDEHSFALDTGTGLHPEIKVNLRRNGDLPVFTFDVSPDIDTGTLGVKWETKQLNGLEPYQLPEALKAIQYWSYKERLEVLKIEDLSLEMSKEEYEAQRAEINESVEFYRKKLEEDLRKINPQVSVEDASK